MKALTGEDVLQLIPPELKMKMYDFRQGSIKVEAFEGHNIPLDLINSTKDLVTRSLKNKTIPVEKTNQEVNLNQFYLFGFSLCAFVKISDNSLFKNAEKVKDLLKDHFGSGVDLGKMIIQQINQTVMFYLAAVTCNYCYGFYTFSLDITNEKDRLKLVIVVKKYEPEKLRFIIHKHPRTAYRVGWAIYDRFEWTDVKPAQLGIENRHNTPIPVYMQRHTWDRMLERLDSLDEDYFTSCIYNSLTLCKAIREKDNFLIEFRVGEVKAGYLVALLINGKLIIRTFLFLTCSGTPEGKRLEELVGLQKLDAKYLGMDKLSTFMSSKISTNKDVQSVFMKADCLHLLELFEKLDCYSSIHPDKSPLESIGQYLQNNDLKLPKWEEEDEEDVITCLEEHLETNEQAITSP